MTEAATGSGGSGLAKSELAYATVRQGIVDGRYGPGSRLVLDQIARELSISPVPVREALRRLEAEGYVVFERNVGARVARIDPSQYAVSMQVLALLEGAATALAAPLLDEAALERARKINQELYRCLRTFDPMAFTRLNTEFHAVLCGPCPNARLLSLIGQETDRLDSIRSTTFAFVPDRARRSVAEHERLVELIASSAPAAEIERCAREHKLATLTAFLQHADSEREQP